MYATFYVNVVASLNFETKLTYSMFSNSFSRYMMNYCWKLILALCGRQDYCCKWAWKMLRHFWVFVYTLISWFLFHGKSKVLMVKLFLFSVPLHVKLKVGRTWGSSETFRPDPWNLFLNELNQLKNYLALVIFPKWSASV